MVHIILGNPNVLVNFRAIGGVCECSGCMMHGKGFDSRYRFSFAEFPEANI